MAGNELNFMRESGFCDFLIIDREGFVVAEEGVLPEEILSFSETISSSFETMNSEYFFWEFNSTRFLSFPFSDYIVVGKVSDKGIVSKIIYFLDDIKEKCGRAIVNI